MLKRLTGESPQDVGGVVSVLIPYKGTRLFCTVLHCVTLYCTVLHCSERGIWELIYSSGTASSTALSVFRLRPAFRISSVKRSWVVMTVEEW